MLFSFSEYAYNWHGWKPKAAGRKGNQYKLGYFQSEFYSCKVVTVEPRLSGLVGTTQNSPDNWGSG